MDWHRKVLFLFKLLSMFSWSWMQDFILYWSGFSTFCLNTGSEYFYCTTICSLSVHSAHKCLVKLAVVVAVIHLGHHQAFVLVWHVECKSNSFKHADVFLSNSTDWCVSHTDVVIIELPAPSHTQVQLGWNHFSRVSARIHICHIFSSVGTASR